MLWRSRKEEARMPDRFLDAARDLRASIDAAARRAGSAPVPRETVDAMYAAGLYGIMAPRDVGGAELPLVDVLDIVAEISRADGSAGWCLMAASGVVSYFGAFCSDAFVGDMFAHGVPRMAMGSNYGTSTREGAGFRVQGRYSFGSGLEAAQWVGAAFWAPGADPGVLRFPNPDILFGALPAGEIEARGNWDVMGLQATASWDYEVREAWIPEGGTFPFAVPERRRGGPRFAMGVLPLTALGHGGFAIGVTRRALDELAVLARTKQRLGSPGALAQSERFLHLLGALEARARAGASWLRETLGRAEATTERTGKPDPAELRALRQAVVHVTQDGADVVRQVYLQAGTTALRTGPLERCFRDMHAASQHFVASPGPTLEFAAEIVASAPTSALDA
jgi:alkylation response protein AidB-like acyl-CoA dehydrogenase